MSALSAESIVRLSLDPDGGRVITDDALERSVFHRLCRVLPTRGYSRVVPIYSPERWSAVERSDPHAALFVSAQPLQHGGEPPSTVLPTTFLLVDADGFYSWLVPEAQESDTAVVEALEQHILDLVGGKYFSHFSGRPADAKHLGTALNESERAEHLRTYCESNLGVLTFFQLNMIFEGLYNASFDPQVFFSTGELTSVEDSNKAKSRYTLHAFFALILARTSLLPDRDGGSAQDAEGVRHGHLFASAYSALCDPAAPSEHGLELAWCSYEHGMPRVARREALHQFLRQTSIHSLLTLQTRLGRSRRALLDDLLGVTHRRFPLVQVESPDEDSETISDVTEGQLRGYVMLISAKLPLLMHVDSHLATLIATDRDAVRGPLSLQPQYDGWRSVLVGVKHDLVGLEQAISQASSDRLLYEEEQVRAEQETLAELARIREDGGASGGGGKTGGLEAFFALAALFYALGNVVPHESWKGLNLLWFAPVAIAATFAAYGLAHLLAALWRERYAHPRFLYEMDLRLDLHIPKAEADKLFRGSIGPDVNEALGLWTDLAGSLPDRIAEGGTAKSGGTPATNVGPEGERTASVADGRHFPEAENGADGDGPANVELATTRHHVDQRRPAPDEVKAAIQASIVHVMDIDRHSYRVERVSEDHAIHKVHLDGLVEWIAEEKSVLASASAWLWRERPMALHLIYELVFQRFADPEHFVLRELRVVGSHTGILTDRQLHAFRLLVGEGFVNRVLAPESRRLQLTGASRDALIELCYQTEIVRTPAPDPVDSPVPTDDT